MKKNDGRMAAVPPPSAMRLLRNNHITLLYGYYWIKIILFAPAQTEIYSLTKKHIFNSYLNCKMSVSH